ncbi:MAG TPA: cytochrome c biogenesis CcdA family protein [Acidimicrobiales bacterium]|jgi:cytochrome c biogenesis protein CcdA
MIDAPLSLAFTAGMVATVNPCGFAMLPAYLSYFLGIGGDEPNDATAGVLRGLVVGLVVSAGFAVLFGIAGILLSATSFSVQRWTTRATPVIGAVLVVAGIAFLRGWEPTVRMPHLHRRGQRDRGMWSMFAFGVSYAVASLSCTIAPFTAVVADTFTRSNTVSGIAALLAYALGMAVLLIALTVALATARHGLLRGLRRALPYVTRASGAIMLVMGGYLVWYGLYEIRLTSHAGTNGGGPIDSVSRLSGSLSDWVNRFGAVRLGLILSLAVVIVVLVALLRTPAGTSVPTATPTTPTPDDEPAAPTP